MGSDHAAAVMSAGAPGLRRSGSRLGPLASVAILFDSEPREARPWYAVAARDGFSPTACRFFTKAGADAFSDAYMAPGGSLVVALRAGDGADLLAMRAQGREACARCGSPDSPCDCPDGLEGYEISPRDAACGGR